MATTKKCTALDGLVLLSTVASQQLAFAFEMPEKCLKKNRKRGSPDGDIGIYELRYVLLKVINHPRMDVSFVHRNLDVIVKSKISRASLYRYWNTVRQNTSSQKNHVTKYRVELENNVMDIELKGKNKGKHFRYFSEQDEKRMASFLEHMDASSLGLDRHRMRKLFIDLANEKGIDDATINKNFINGFMRRHPYLGVIRASNIDKIRADKLL